MIHCSTKLYKKTMSAFSGTFGYLNKISSCTDATLAETSMFESSNLPMSNHISEQLCEAQSTVFVFLTIDLNAGVSHARPGKITTII